MNLYRVTLKGMTYSAVGVVYGKSYVVAENTDAAYEKVRIFLDDNGIGFSKDRVLNTITLIAGSEEFPACSTKLYL